MNLLFRLGREGVATKLPQFCKPLAEVALIMCRINSAEMAVGLVSRKKLQQQIIKTGGLVATNPGKVSKLRFSLKK